MTQETIKALVVDLEGQTEVITIPPGQFQSEFRKTTGAQYFDHLALAADLDVWVDDEGLLTQPVEVNRYLTQLRDEFWTDSGIDIPPGWPPLAGKALLTGGANDEGETLSLSDDLIAHLEDWFKEARES